MTNQPKHTKGEICDIKSCEERAVLEVRQLDIKSEKYKFCKKHFEELYWHVLNFEVRYSDKLISIGKTAEILGVHTETLRRWDNSGKLKAVRINNRGDRRYLLKDIYRYI